MFEKWNRISAGYSLPVTLASVTAVILLSFSIVKLGFSEVNAAILYLVAVMAVACSTKGYIYGSAASVVFMMSFNYFFSEPVYSFNVRDTTYLFTFLVMFSASFLVSTLTTKLMNMTVLAREREQLAVEKEIAQAAIKEEQLKNSLLRAISHDLRTPLTSITGSAEMLLGSLPEGENRLIADAIRNDADWLMRLVENILSMTKIQDGLLKASIRPEVCEEVAESAVFRIRKYYPDRIIRLMVPEEVVLVPMDIRLIEQVLINLLENAVRHTSAEQGVTLSIHMTEEAAWFTVEDEGSGIASEDLPHLFEAFYTKNRQRGDSRRGIGLGLAICQTIVNQHGGVIGAENRSEGGARFSFSLPLKGACSHE